MKHYLIFCLVFFFLLGWVGGGEWGWGLTYRCMIWTICANALRWVTSDIHWTSSAKMMVVHILALSRHQTPGNRLDAFTVIIPWHDELSSRHVPTRTRTRIDQSHRYGRHQAACSEPAGSYDKTTRTAICFEHKTQYLLIRAPYTLIVVFWHISNIPPMISQSQISCNTPTVYITAIFVKYCYTTGNWLL